MSSRVPDPGATGRVVAVLGATGFVGRQLMPVLIERGHQIRALTRSPDQYDGLGTPTYADLDDPTSLEPALTGCDVAYLLSHALGTPGFEEREAAQAEGLARAAATVTLGQLVFLSGLGRDDGQLSPHLRSRRAVERILQAADLPVTVLRAGILVGAGSTGWEMLRQMLDALPVMVTDARARTSHQPIAVEDAVGYLADVLGNEACLRSTIEIGGADVLTYAEMVRTVADLTQSRRPVEVPWVPNLVSAVGVHLLTEVDGPLAQDLLDSMRTVAVVTDDSAQRLLPRAVLGFEEAARRALAQTDV